RLNSNNERHPLLAATDKEHLEIVKHLIESTGCDINVKEERTGSTPLHKACYNGSLSIVEYLISKPQCDIEAKDKEGNKPLHYAACQGHKEIVLILGKKVSQDGLFECMALAKQLAEPDIMKLLNNLYKERILLLYACKFNNVDIVCHLVIDKNCDVNAKGINGYTPLHVACARCSFDTVQFLTNSTKCNLEAEDNYQTRPLHFACQSGNVDVVCHLVIDKHCDVTAEQKDGLTPLHLACLNRSFETVQFLTSSTKSNIEAEDNDQDRPLHLACQSGNVDIVRHLVIDKHCDVNSKRKDGFTPLHVACLNPNFETVQFLTSSTKCNIEAEDNDQDRPLHLACVSGNVDIVRHLVIDKHCDVNAKGRNGLTPLHVACLNCSFETVQFLTSSTECNIKAEDNDQNRPLHSACQSGSVDIVRHLVVNKHCDVNAKRKDGFTPLHVACLNCSFETVQFLTSSTESNIEAEDNDQNRPLHLACQSGSVDIVRHLVVNKHCDVNAKRKDGFTPLHVACLNCSFETVQFLTSSTESNIEAEDNDQNRPLHLACQSGSVDIVRHLVVNKHCDVDTKRKDGLTPLHLACLNCSFETVQFLTSSTECNIEAKSGLLSRPLHLACQSGNVDIVRHLVIDKHCNVNAKRKDGLTPLHLACLNPNFETVQFLTSSTECNIEAEDNDQSKPLHSACESGNVDIVRHLVIDKHLKGCNTQGITTYNRKTNSYLHIHQSSGIALLRVVKCILTGPPGAGKSTLKKRLLNQSLDTGPSLSTGVIDAAVQVNSFRKLSQHNAVVTTEWKEQELDEEAILITKKLLPASNTSDESSTRPTTPHEILHESTSTPQPMSVNETVGLTSSIESKQESPKGFDLSPITSQQGNKNVSTSSPMCMETAAIDTVVVDESLIMEHENIPSSPAKIVNCEEEESNTEVQNSSSSVNDSVKGLSDYVMKIPVRKREEYEEKFEEAKDDHHTMLHIIDTGGQPEFHEILPALITGPAINLLVFKLTKDLRSRYEIIYRTSSGDSKPYETSLTHEEVIFRSLASIACLRQNTIGWRFDEMPIEDKSEPVAFLIATHRDQVDENKVSEVNQQLRTKIENSSHLFDSDLTTQECGIKDTEEFRNVLWYLHHRVGIIMHYPNVAGLEDIIITDLQLVFDRITNLITTCFTFEQLKSAAVRKEFCKNGRFSESQLDKISLREKGDPLNAKRLVTLLKHLYIVAGPMKAKVD
ncbi:PREDICTED: ankyrin-3-like, partial [Amphimedon queenslandica]|uniref:C-terminal of Roc (COR) domain-containing protein n=2 Tax=Amphimedon queenslandica TaxID=400682 RepID=A0AAN0J0C2_AMPQE